MARDYFSRKYGNRKPKSVLYILTEGTQTEPIYFKSFRDQGMGFRLEVKPAGANDPVRIINCAVKMKRKVLEDEDEIWCVFDFDNHSSQAIQEAYQIAQEHGVRIASSNPAFELWYLLHYECPTTRMTNQQLINRMRVHLQTYSKTQDLTSTLFPLQATAISNAQRLVAQTIGRNVSLQSTDSNPVTTVHDLVNHINIKKQNQN